MVKETFVGKIAAASRLKVSGGIAPAKLEIAVAGLEGLHHNLLGWIHKQDGVMELLLDPHIVYDLSSKLAKKNVGEAYIKSQKVAKNRFVPNLDFNKLVGKGIVITVDIQL